MIKTNVSYLVREKESLNDDLITLLKDAAVERDLEKNDNPQISKVDDLAEIICDLSGVYGYTCSPTFISVIDSWGDREDIHGIYQKYGSSLESIVIANFQ